MTKACNPAEGKWFGIFQRRLPQAPEVVRVSPAIAGWFRALPGITGWFRVWPTRCEKGEGPNMPKGAPLPPAQQEERRKWPRLSLAIPIFVRSRDGEGKEVLELATAVNIGAGGALVAVRRSLPLPAQVLLEIPSPPTPALAEQSSASRMLPARTVRITHAEGYHLIGMKFARPLSENGNGRPARRPVRRKVASLV
jgi:hypothetical protein